MRNLILALFIGLAALSAAACGNSGSTTAPGDSLAPVVSPSDSTTESEAPLDSTEPSPAAS